MHLRGAQFRFSSDQARGSRLGQNNLAHDTGHATKIHAWCTQTAAVDEKDIGHRPGYEPSGVTIEQPFRQIRPRPCGARQDLLQAVAVFEARQRGILAQPEIQGANPDTPFGAAWILVRPGLADRDACRALVARSRVPALGGCSACDNDFDQAALGIPCQSEHLCAQSLHVGKIDAQPAASECQALAVQIEESRRTAHAGDGFEQPVAELQAPIEHTDLCLRPAVHQSHRVGGRVATGGRAVGPCAARGRRPACHATAPAA